MPFLVPQQPSHSALPPERWTALWQRTIKVEDSGPWWRQDACVVEPTRWGAVIWRLPTDEDPDHDQAVVHEVLVAAPETDPGVPYRAAKRRVLQRKRMRFVGMPPPVCDIPLSLTGIGGAVLMFILVILVAPSLAGSNLLVLGIPLIAAGYFGGAAAPDLLNRIDQLRPQQQYRTVREPGSDLLDALDAVARVSQAEPTAPGIQAAAWAISDPDRKIDQEAIQTCNEITAIVPALPTDQAHQTTRVLPELLLSALTATDEHRGIAHSNLNDLRDSAHALAAARRELDETVASPQLPVTLTDAEYADLEEEARQHVIGEETQSVVRQLGQEASILRAVRDEIREREHLQQPVQDEDQ